MGLNRLLDQAKWLFDRRLFDLGGTSVTVGSIVVLLAILILTYLASRTMQRAMERAAATRLRLDPGTLGVLKRLLHYVVFAVGLGVGLQTIGIDLGALFAAGAVFAIGIGLAMQNLAQNFVSGVILLLERAIKPGDVLEVDGRVVRVVRLGIRATIARTLDDEDIIVPNSTIVQSVVTNYTLSDSLFRLRTTVGVVYGSDMRVVREVLEGTASTLEWRSPEKTPVVLLSQFGSSSVDWEVSVWIDDPWKMRQCRSRLNEAIWWALKEREITIAFPQVDVHFDPPVVDSLRRAVGD